jgi:hypothetical protein
LPTPILSEAAGVANEANDGGHDNLFIRKFDEKLISESFQCDKILMPSRANLGKSSSVK